MSSNGAARPISVGVVGAGFGGIGMGIRLRQEGIEDFEIFERGATVGGVWRANTYPGAACDVPSHLYSFSFAPGHNWSRRYAPQPEIQEYMEEITDRFGMRPHLRLGTEVTSATFDEASGRWTVTRDSGESREFDVLVTACGQLTRPQVPHVEGIADFEGRVFHSAEWDHSHDLKGRDVAVIGTGASAIQFVPEIQPDVARLTLFQRTPPWVLPHRDRPITRAERTLYRRVPALQRAVRAGVYWTRELTAYGMTKNPRFLNPIEKLGRTHLAKAVADPVLREKLTPSFSPGCKRLLMSNDYYPALAADNVEVVPDGIAGITPSGIRTIDGVEHEVDTIIFGTGFAV
ncbi:MAG: hypothetical protein QOI31_378, partial [Solirubrobacterales bacterium]|nr:hypothetical protein [Solirubrobacterales bacterium]